jgi:hypothetical protein
MIYFYILGYYWSLLVGFIGIDNFEEIVKEGIGIL